MAALRALLLIVAALFGGGLASQAPEYAQQYRQRIGGALDELSAIVRQFDDDARRNGLDRTAALATYDRSGEPFLRDRGISMASILARYELLTRQRTELDRTIPALRPILLFRERDRTIAAGAWSDFRLAVPLGPEGWLWGGIGAALGAIVAALVWALGALPFRRRRSIRQTDTVPTIEIRGA